MARKAFFSLLSAVVAVLSHCSIALSRGSSKFITPEIDDYIKSAIQQWNLTGLAVAIVRRDPDSATGWAQEFQSYGIARADGTPVTADTLFNIASNSKLFTASAVGLLISNGTLQEERSFKLSLSTKAKDVFGDLWGLWDEEASRGTNIQDMLAHRTGLPRHDGSSILRKGGLAEQVKTLRYLRPSAEFRETFQYNNLMYDSLGYLPELFFNQTLGSYVDQHIFKQLNMSSATYSVTEAEKDSSLLAHGFQTSGQNLKRGFGGIKKEVVPYFIRPGEEEIGSGSGGVFVSARDAVTWVSSLLASGRHPYENKQVIPTEVVERMATGVSVTTGVGLFPETSVQEYGGGQNMYSYRGFQIIEHQGNNIGFSSSISRLPNDNLGIVLFSNDWDPGYAHVAIKWRLVDEIVVKGRVPSSPVIDWISRFKAIEQGNVAKINAPTPRPENPSPPSKPFFELNSRTYRHLTYGDLQTCFVSSGLVAAQPTQASLISTCTTVMDSLPVQRILNITDLSIPTVIIPFKSTFITHMRLSHFSGNLFNATAFYTNADVRLAGGFGSIESGVWTDDGDVVISMLDFLTEWVTEGADEGLAFKGDMWGMGARGREPEGEGKAGAEVWFSRVN